MNFNENLRGQTNSIVLFILLNGDRHTDELKEIIDDKFSTVKIGTLYSVISRMKTQGQITEYRASSNDGSRRKYYKITEHGKKLFFDEYYELFEGITLPEKQEPQVQEPKEEIIDENEELYLKYIKKAETANAYDDIDFSSVAIDEPKIEPEIQNSTPLSIFDEKTEDNTKQSGIDYDSIVSSEYEYKSVLNKLFPKRNSYDETYFDEYAFTKREIDIQPSHPAEVNVKSELQQNQEVNTFDTIYDLSEKENIKIRTSGDTNRYQGTKILANKLRFHSAILLLIIAILEYLLTTFILAGSVTFNSRTLIKITVIFGIFALVMGIIYALKHNHTVKDLPKFINSIELAIIVAIGTIIITLCIASINSVNMYNFTEVYSAILLPSIMVINLPLYVAIVHFLSKLDIYQTI